MTIEQILSGQRPSFYTLHKQGRFRRVVADVASDDIMQQKERFAVAMVGFTLQYETDFCRKFLAVVCGIAKNIASDPVQVEFEVPGCGDLAIHCGDKSFFFEFKIKAPLEPRQDPNNKLAFEEEKRGYGFNIRGISQQSGVACSYTVITNTPLVFSPKTTSQIVPCFSRSWNDIFRCHSIRKGVSHDLFESLGSLEIQPFVRMRSQKLQLGARSVAAGKLHNLLKDVQIPADLRKTKLEVGGDGSYIGMNFRPSSANSRWERWLAPKNDTIGWYGYDGSDLGVCFYCGDRAHAANIRDRLKKQFGNPSERSKIDIGKDNTAFIYFPSADSTGDREWFEAVFTALEPESTK